MARHTAGFSRKVEFPQAIRSCFIQLYIWDDIWQKRPNVLDKIVIIYLRENSMQWLTNITERLYTSWTSLTSVGGDKPLEVDSAKLNVNVRREHHQKRLVAGANEWPVILGEQAVLCHITNTNCIHQRWGQPVISVVYFKDIENLLELEFNDANKDLLTWR